MGDVALREDVYGTPDAGLWASAPQDEILRYWLGNEIPRASAEKALSKPVFAEQGTYIVRRASDKVNYAITVCEGNKICSYKVTDLGLGQVGIQTGQSFRSLEYLLEFFYEEKFPDATGTHVPLKHMCTEPERQLDGCPPMPEPQEYEERYDDADGVSGGGAADMYGEDDTYQDIDEGGGAPPARPPPLPQTRAAPPPPADVYGEDGDDAAPYGEDGDNYGDSTNYGEVTETPYGEETNYGEGDEYGEGGGPPDVYGDDGASPYGEDESAYGE